MDSIGKLGTVAEDDTVTKFRIAAKYIFHVAGTYILGVRDLGAIVLFNHHQAFIGRCTPAIVANGAGKCQSNL